MFGKKNDNRPQGRIDSLIGVGTIVEGNVRFSGGLRVDGVVLGNVLAEGAAKDSTLVLSEQAKIEGAVSVAHLVSNGTVIGPVTAVVSLEMQAKAKIIGDVDYAMIELHQGAVIEGRLLHRSPEADVAPAEEPKAVESN